MGDNNLARLLCSAIDECGVAVVETIGSQHTHLGPVSEEHMVFKRGYSKRMWRLRCPVENNFPTKPQMENGYGGEETSICFPYELKVSLYLSKPL